MQILAVVIALVAMICTWFIHQKQALNLSLLGLVVAVTSLILGRPWSPVRIAAARS